MSIADGSLETCSVVFKILIAKLIGPRFTAEVLKSAF